MKEVGFFRRIFSLFYDTMIIAAIIFSLTLLLVVVNGESIKPGSLLSFAQLLIIVFTGPVFYSYFWMNNFGQTIGMQAWKIRLVSNSEENLELKQCIVRCLGSLISFGFLGLGYFYIFFDAKKRSWSDLISKTNIIKELS
ncbi:MAG: RDD family protein [SAR86 cluster bacterium]|jgi:uncharacterized RDD family membrane protein YckC|nr:RDD family protein [SAR86 cluster bacterium]